MKILQLRTISGPNVFHGRPVIVMTVQLEDLANTASNEIPGYNERLVAMLPGLHSHRCSPGRPGGFIERLQRGTYFAHMIEHIALELSQHCGIGVGYGKTIYDGAEGKYKIIVRYRSEKGMRYLLRVAMEVAQAAVDGREYDIDGALAALAYRVGVQVTPEL
jgi:cyanophycin synthetase